MNRPNLILLLCFLCLSAAAQEKTFRITGKVSGNERGSETPLTNAYIQLKEKPGNGFLTDSSGIFRIDHLTKGKYHITVSFVGFESCQTTVHLKNKPTDTLYFVLPLYYDKREVSAKQARKEIRQGHPHLYACTKDEKNTAFQRFDEKYKVGFFIYNPQTIRNGQQFLSAPPATLIRYNREIFKYLDKTFGKNWRQETPPGIFGHENRID